MDGLGIAGRVLLNGINGVERDGWTPLSPSPIQLVYRVDVVTDGVLIFEHVCNFRSRFYIGWNRFGWTK